MRLCRMRWLHNVRFYKIHLQLHWHRCKQTHIIQSYNFKWSCNLKSVARVYLLYNAISGCHMVSLDCVIVARLLYFVLSHFKCSSVQLWNGFKKHFFGRLFSNTQKWTYTRVHEHTLKRTIASHVATVKVPWSSAKLNPLTIILILMVIGPSLKVGRLSRS